MERVLIALLVVVIAGVTIPGLVRSRARARRALRMDQLLAAHLGDDGGRSLAIRPALERALSLPGRDGDLWERLRSRLDFAQFRPKLAADAEVKRFALRWGNDYAMVANPRDMLYYRLEPWEADLLPLFDGSRTVGDVVVERLQSEGDLDPEGITDLVEILRVGRLLDPVPVDTNKALTTALDPRTAAQRKLTGFLKTLSIDWAGAHGFVAWWYRHLLRPLFTPIGWVVSSIVAAGGFVAFVVVHSSGRFSLGDGSAPAESLILLALSFVLTFFHELGHAAAIVHYGRRVKSAGFMIYFGSPAFFVEASDSLMLDRRQRIVQSAAGPFSELVIAGATCLFLVAFPDSSVAELLYRFALLNYFVIFLNLIPLLELDGYWILSDLIQVPDLRPRSLEFIQHDIWHKLRTRERFTAQEIGLGFYALVGLAFTILCFYWAFFFWRRIFGGLITSLWNGGVGSRLLLLALGLFLGGPALRGLVMLGRAIGRRVAGLVRRIRFRVETKWRVEAAELIDALPAFDDLPVDVLNDVAGRVRLRSVRPGQPVFRQGDRPRAMYVVRRGRVGVEDEDPDSHDVQVIRTLERGDSFGELGLLQGSARSATVRAVDEVELFEVDRGTFDRLLADSIHAPEFAPTMQSLMELRALPTFDQLGSAALADLLRHGRWIAAAPGSTLIEEGEEADAFYVIGSGQVRVSAGGTVLRTLGPGTFFGELALLDSSPRTATVVAITPVRCFRLDREGFDQIVADSFRVGTLKPTADRTWQH